MESIREYLLSVTAGALLCGILSSLVEKNAPGAGIGRLVSGLFLTLTVLKPLGTGTLTELTALPDTFSQEAEQAAAAGEEYARQARLRLIKEQTEAYILDKAAAYGLALRVEVTVEEETLIPRQVTIRGDVSPYARQQLQQMIAQDLGIGKEDQQWMESGSG